MTRSAVFGQFNIKNKFGIWHVAFFQMRYAVFRKTKKLGNVLLLKNAVRCACFCSQSLISECEYSYTVHSYKSVYKVSVSMQQDRKPLANRLGVKTCEIRQGPLGCLDNVTKLSPFQSPNLSFSWGLGFPLYYYYGHETDAYIVLVCRSLKVSISAENHAIACFHFRDNRKYFYFGNIT